MKVRLRITWRTAAGLALAATLLVSTDALAVVPALVGPVQALAAILPQLLAMLGAAAVAMLKPETYKTFFKFLWHQKLLSLGIVAGIALVIWGAPKLFTGKVEAVESGTAWPAMRGGPSRPGAVPNAKGPAEAARVRWSYAGRKRERVDSSPAVVGNRVYYSSAVLSLFGGGKSGTGTLYCRDVENGGLVWEYNGEGLAGGRLASIFASPAVGGEFKDIKGQDGKPEEGKYLVSGEGYHIDIDSRFFCLDLEPVRNGRAPEVVWQRQATDHVESSPCILKCHDGVWRTWVGAGEDGVWCMELEKDNLAWLVQGTPAFYLAADAPEIEKFRALAGKNVKVTGEIKRVGSTLTNPGVVLLTRIGDFEEVARAETVLKDAGRGFTRTIFGKVVVGEVPSLPGDTPGTTRTVKEASGVRVEIPRIYLDVESAPVAVVLPKDPAKPEGEKETLLFFGCGIGGRAGVACLDAVTGEERWFHQVKNPVFSAPTVVTGLKLKVPDGQGGFKERVADVVMVGYGEGDFVNVAANPEGTVLCLDIRAESAEKRVLWEVKTGDTILGAVAAWPEDSRAYACARDGNLYAIDMRDGSSRKTRVAGSLVCAPALTKDAIYVVSLSGMSYCLDRPTLAPKWKLALMPCGDMYASPVVTAGRVLVGTPGQGLYCLEEDPEGATRLAKAFAGPGCDASRSGAADAMGLPSVEGDKAPARWREQFLKDRTVEGPVAACGGWFYLNLKEAPRDDAAGAGAGTGAGVRFAAVSPELARIRWETDLGAPATAVVARQERVGGQARKEVADRVFALYGANGREQNLCCLDAANNGARLWNTPGVYLRDVLALGRDRLVVARADGLECLDAQSQKQLWRCAIRNPSGSTADPVGAPAMVDGLVLTAVGGEQPRLICIEDGGGRILWEHPLPPGEPAGPPAAANGRVLVACRSAAGADGQRTGSLVCVRISNGMRLWKADLPSAPLGHPAIDEALAVVVAEDGKLYTFEAMPGKPPPQPDFPAPPPEVDAKLTGAERRQAEQDRDKLSKDLLRKYELDFSQWEKTVREALYPAKAVREEGLPVGKLPQPPALVGGVVVLSAERRMWSWNLATSLSAWSFRDQGLIGRMLAPPVVMNEAVYAVTERRGLVAVGDNPVVKLLTTLEGVKVPLPDAWALAARLRTVRALRGASAQELAAIMTGESEDEAVRTQKSRLAGGMHTALHADDVQVAGKEKSK